MPVIFSEIGNPDTNPLDPVLAARRGDGSGLTLSAVAQKTTKTGITSCVGVWYSG